MNGRHTKGRHLNDADRLRIHGRVMPMDPEPLMRRLPKHVPDGPSSEFPAKGRNRITVAAYALLAATVIHLLYWSFHP